MNTPQTSSPPLRLDGVGVTVGGHRLLRGVDLTVQPGDALAVLGANGSGKSTLVRTALGQLPIASGRADLFGTPVHDTSRVPWERLGYVPQRLAAASPVPATVAEVVQSGLLGRRRWRPRRGDRDLVVATLDRLGVADLADRPFGVLSGGQAQRAIIARALVRDPDLLVLDEPLAGLDVLTQSTFASLLTELHAEGRTIVMVLHELGPFAGLLDRAVVLSAGRVVHDGALPVSDHAHPDAHLHAHEHDHLHVEHGMPAEPDSQRSLP